MANFFGLPAELRNRIYDLALPTGQRIDLTKRPNVPPICRTSRQLRSETLPMWRGTNMFILRTGLDQAGVIGIGIASASALEAIYRHLDSGFTHIQQLRVVHLWKPDYWNTLNKRAVILSLTVVGHRYQMDFRIDRHPRLAPEIPRSPAARKAGEAALLGMVATMEAALERKLVREDIDEVANTSC